VSFSSPVWLIALGAIPALLLGQAVARRRARRYAIRFTALSTLRAAAGMVPTWRRRIPAALVMAAIGVLALALARPQLSYRKAVRQASLMLVTDHSGSMAAVDVQPTRLLAAVRAANTFIDQLPGSVKVGAVAFSSSPDAVQAPASDHTAARSIVDAQAADGATATGDALALALQLLRGGDRHHPPAAIVLLSDGAANAGVDARAVARQAAQDRIPIYTVALGTPDGTLPNPDPFGSPLAVPPDPQLMLRIAQDSGGRAFNAQSADELSLIYTRLGRQLGSVVRRREVTSEFAVAGIALLLLAAAGSARWSGRLP
jgi:Ca-activated chloride channel family protein